MAMDLQEEVCVMTGESIGGIWQDWVEVKDIELSCGKKKFDQSLDEVKVPTFSVAVGNLIENWKVHRFKYNICSYKICIRE